MSGGRTAVHRRDQKRRSLVHLCRLQVVQPPLDLGGGACEEGGEGAGQVS